MPLPHAHHFLAGEPQGSLKIHLIPPKTCDKLWKFSAPNHTLIVAYQAIDDHFLQAVTVTLRKITQRKSQFRALTALALTLWTGMALADSITSAPSMPDLLTPDLLTPDLAAPAPSATEGTPQAQELLPARLGAENSLSSPRGACPAAGQAYRKKLLITAFPRREQSSSNVGALHDVEHALPALLAERLRQSQAVADSQLLAQGLTSDAGLPGPSVAQAARRLAKHHQVQLVLSGEVLDMSMTQPGEGFSPGLASRARNGLVATFGLPSSWDSRQRHFVLQLTLRDGITGELLARHQYHSQGAWNADRPHRVGFDSPRFWKTDYGEALADLIDRASADLAKQIRCQPLTASLDMPTSAGRIILHSGMDQGLKAGDRLRLYKVIFRAVPGEYRVYRAHLVGSAAHIEVREPRGSYSLAQLHSNITLHGRYVALATAHKPGHTETARAR